MNTYLFSVISRAEDTAGNFGADHAILNKILDAINSTAASFGKLADSLYSVNVNVDSTDIGKALTGIGAGLLTFFMVLEIITFCFNIDFHAGFESAMKIGVRTVLMYILVENCPKAAKAVVEVFKTNMSEKFEDQFQKITDPFLNMGADMLNGNTWYEKYIMPMALGLVLIVSMIFIIIVFCMILMSLVGIVAETTILTALAPVACSTLVNGQVRQTGITFLKNLAAISIQWGIVSLCFDIYTKLVTEITNAGINSIGGSGNDIVGIVVSFFAPAIGLIMLSTMISKSGDITKRALGV